MASRTNKPLLAVLIGILIIFPVEIYTQIAKQLGLTNLTTFELTSTLLNWEPNWWLGLISGPGIAGIAVLVIYYLTRLWGSDYIIIKSMIIGMVTYSVIAIVTGGLVNNPNSALTISGHYVHAGAGAFGGFMAGYLLKKYLVKSNKEADDSPARRYKIASVPVKKPEYEKKTRFIKPKKI